ncbi:MAG: flagellar biosynthesis protein FlhF [Planctomycetota bacterium]|jgi:flagellar biosynthesis protein FlhF
MQIHRVRGKDLKDALQRAREVHGDDAMVLTHELVADGGVTVSVTRSTRDGDTKRKARKSAPDSSGGQEPGLRDVGDRLRMSGASPELADSVIEQVLEEGAQGAFAIDTAAASLAKHFVAYPSPTASGGPRVIAFVGPTGSGKSASLAKLAIRLKRAGRNIAVASLDTGRFGATELLREISDQLDVPFTRIRYHEDIGALMAHSANYDAILLDTAGRSPVDHKRLGQLRMVLTESLKNAVVNTYLVVSASTGKEVLEEVHRGFAGLQPEALVVTKLDETRRTAVALEFANETSLPVAFLCNGQDLKRDLYMATSDRMADLVLGGRVR